MTYQLVNDAERCFPAPATAQPERTSTPWRGAPGGGPWRAAWGWLAESFRRSATRAESLGRPARRDWDQQLRRELLRIDARRIL